MDKALSHLQTTCIYIGILNQNHCFDINISYKFCITLAIGKGLFRGVGTTAHCLVPNYTGRRRKNLTNSRLRKTLTYFSHVTCCKYSTFLKIFPYDSWKIKTGKKVKDLKMQILLDILFFSFVVLIIINSKYLSSILLFLLSYSPAW